MMTRRPVPIDLRTPGTSFVARERELARLGTALAAAADGCPSSLLIAGEAGVGKTRLVHEFARRVGGQAQVLLGSCSSCVAAASPMARSLMRYGRLNGTWAQAG
jgi:Cdc6-like AAA superfamily ATPase